MISGQSFFSLTLNLSARTQKLHQRFLSSSCVWRAMPPRVSSGSLAQHHRSMPLACERENMGKQVESMLQGDA